MEEKNAVLQILSLKNEIVLSSFFFKESYKADRYLINFVIVLFNKAIAC